MNYSGAEHQDKNVLYQNRGYCWIHIYVDIKGSCKRTQWLRIPTCICGRVTQCRSAPGRYPWP